ncbi:MAG: NADH-quinone oxidoreductase subunit J [Planctomycetia bacterium]|jgi:NADH:ubiquinone oxidoreductase subunit 6 (subunit J)
MDPINWHSCCFLLFGLLAGGFAIAVAVSNDIVRMAIYLVFSLAAVAGLFLSTGADLVGAMQIMVYVGGTVVLIAFGVMLTARTKIDTLRARGSQWVLATVVAGCLLVMLFQAAISVKAWHGPESTPETAAASELETSKPIGLSLMGVRPDQLEEPDPVRRAGMSGYLLAFEIVSVHLLVVLIGAAFLARAKWRKG